MEWFAQQPAGGGFNMIMLMVPIFIIMYVLMIRPQKLKEKKRKEMLSKIEKNDHVVTVGGIHGTIITVKDDEVILKVDESSNTRLKLTRSSIARIFDQENPDEDDLPE